MAEEIKKEEIKKCSHCQMDIPFKTKRCPHCQGDLRSSLNRHPVLGAILIIFLIGLGIFFWYISLPILFIWYVWRKMNIGKRKKIIITAIILTIFSIVFLVKTRSVEPTNIAIPIVKNNTSTETKVLTEEEKAALEEKKKQQQIKAHEDFKSQLQREIDSTVNFDGSPYRENVLQIQIELALFSVWANLINKAKSSENEDIKNLGKHLEKNIVYIQTKEFPLMRKAYGKIVNKLLWEHNIDVNVYDTNNKTIEFIGAMFANNKNIKDTQTTLSEMLNLLRFSKAIYKWYEYDEDYTYYDMKARKDNEIIEIK